LIYLLDSNACITWMRGDNEKFIEQALHRPAGFGELVLCSVVKAELLFGVHTSARSSENLQRTLRFFGGFLSLPFDDQCAARYGELRAFLRQKGLLIGPNDLLIAATALAHGATLVTHNTAEFSRVPGLLFEDWEA